MSLDEKLSKYRLNHEEYQMICDRLGREPRGVEWALFSAMWSEHCSYKSSRVHLKKLFNKGKHVLESFGENAGVLDIGDGEKIAFKMESHNHPSFIEPYQGAATGVGGILRDIFTMGARPIALANYLCFGEKSAPRCAELLDGVVRGIGGYGNCVGVPTITGQTEFHGSYNDNILVNAFALGYFSKNSKVFLSKGQSAGQYVVYVGARTGSDGIHGASMASESFEEGDESKRPTVQIGDPFFEKLLIESCIEVMDRNLVTSIQDMGAAGLTSSSFEMASKSGLGMKMRLDKVPLRDDRLGPEEILLSESQERMLLMCEPEKFDELRSVFERWELEAVKIGEVTKERNVQLFWHNEKVVDIDPNVLVEDAPMYQRPFSPWNEVNRTEKLPKARKFKKELLSDERLTSRSWIYDQYDQRVGAKTEKDCSDSVGVLRLGESGKSLGIVLGCRPYMMRFDAYEGGKDSVFYPALQLASKGFTPLGLTDCLNFGNPEKPEIMSQFVASLEGMNAACESINCPIISGNVSFYNETQGKNITSTPATGIVGLRKGKGKTLNNRFSQNGNHLLLLESLQLITTGLAAEIAGEKIVGKGSIDIREVSEFITTCMEASEFEGVVSSHVVGKMGLEYSLFRMSTEDLGVTIEDVHGELFEHERLYQVLFEVEPDRSAAFCEKFGADVLGEITEGSFVFGDEKFDLKEISTKYNNGLRGVFEDLA